MRKVFLVFFVVYEIVELNNYLKFYFKIVLMFYYQKIKFKYMLFNGEKLEYSDK